MFPTAAISSPADEAAQSIPPASLLPPAAHLLQPRSPHLMWNRNSIRLVLLNLFHAVIQQTGMAMVQGAAASVQAAGAARQLTCSPRSSAFVHMLFLTLFAAPDWKSSFPTGRQVKFHTGRPPPPHSLPNILLFGAVCASENSSLPQPPPQEQR